MHGGLERAPAIPPTLARPGKAVALRERRYHRPGLERAPQTPRGGSGRPGAAVAPLVTPTRS